VYIVDAERPAVVETGIGTHHERVLAALDACGIDRTDLEVIAPTHVHLDHAGGAGYLAEACPNADVYVHEVGAEHLVDPTALVEGTKRAVGDQWECYVEPKPVPADRIVELTDGDPIDLGDRELLCHHTPGHAPHQVVFESPADDAVYTADAAGIYVPEWDAVEPTTPPPNFDLEQALADVELLQTLDPAVLLFAHFGPRETDQLLAEYRLTLVEWVEEITHLRESSSSDEAVVEQVVERTQTAEVWGERKARAETAMNVRGVLHSLDR
jgi:glyoxylase-like metal-dependent hydrolase (beta-lactamase superfamily II)